MNRIGYQHPDMLKITSSEWMGLADLADRLEKGEIINFNVRNWGECIGGNLEQIVPLDRRGGDEWMTFSAPLDRLFFPGSYEGKGQVEAAVAIHHFLSGNTTDPWQEKGETIRKIEEVVEDPLPPQDNDKDDLEKDISEIDISDEDEDEDGDDDYPDLEDDQD